MDDAHVKARRWKDGEVLWAETSLIKMAYVVTHEPGKVGTVGRFGTLFVEFIDPDYARLWDHHQ